MEFRGCKYAVFDGLFWDQRPSSLARTMALNSEIACCTLPSSHTLSAWWTATACSVRISSQVLRRVFGAGWVCSSATYSLYPANTAFMASSATASASPCFWDHQGPVDASTLLT